MKIDNVRGVVEECRFEHRGYPCVVLFMDMGHRCGYVGIPKNDISELDSYDINPYGGITYGPCPDLHFQEDEDVEWIGFDTGHWGDGRDINSVQKYFGIERAKEVLSFPTYVVGTVKTLEFCKKQCMDMVDQIVQTVDLKGE